MQSKICYSCHDTNIPKVDKTSSQKAVTTIFFMLKRVTTGTPLYHTRITTVNDLKQILKHYVHV